jgi:hypothetical protein
MSKRDRYNPLGDYFSEMDKIHADQERSRERYRKSKKPPTGNIAARSEMNKKHGKI